MRRLAPPSISANTSYASCASGVGKRALKEKYDTSLTDFEACADDYGNKLGSGDLYRIPNLIAAVGTDPIVIGDVTKSELVKLYEYYMLRKHPARSIYDTIMLAAKERCPYCGGIGRPRTLDHYLPKASFPQFSVLPMNLCPSCKDCNEEGKGTSFAHRAEDQVLHPYGDPDHFFNEQWVFAKVLQDESYSLLFYSDPPNNWSATDIARAHNHFDVFDLSTRYSIQAAEELSTVEDARKVHLSSLSQEEFSNELLQRSAAPSLFPNHWKKVMYQALAKDEGFCSHVF